MSYLNDILQSLVNLGPEMQMMLICIGAGYVCRILAVIPNKWIPRICIALPLFIYPFLTNAGRVDPDVRHPIVRIEGTAFLIGVLAWILHDKVIAHVEDWLEKRFPKLMKPLIDADAKDSAREVTKAVQTIVTETAPESKVLTADVTIRTTETKPAESERST